MIEAPNYTQTPNAIYALMPEMSEAELRVTLAICRQTFGWHRGKARISLADLERATGMSKQGVLQGIEAGAGRGIIAREAVDESNPRRGFFYCLLVNEVDKQAERLVNEVDKPCQRGGQGLVNEVDNIKEKEIKEEIKTADGIDTSEDRASKSPVPTRRNPPPSSAVSDSETRRANNEADQFEDRVACLVISLEALNRALVASGQYGRTFKPFADLTGLARGIVARGEGEAELRKAANICLKADRPAGALLRWMRDGFLPESLTAPPPRSPYFYYDSSTGRAA